MARSASQCIIAAAVAAGGGALLWIAWSSFRPTRSAANGSAAAADGESVRAKARRLLEWDPKDKHGNGPLGTAAKHGDAELCRALVDAGADLEATNKLLTTAMHWAASSGSREVVELLAARGAVVTAPDKRRQTPLHWAAVNGCAAVIQCLCAPPYSVDVEALSAHGWSALHFATFAGKVDAVRALVDAGGANLEATDSDGATPLHNAAAAGNAELVQLLAARGANVEATDNDKWTALHRAARHGHCAAVEVLVVGLRVDVAARSIQGKTPGQLAEEQGHAGVVAIIARARE
jgi:ankyrin repeat protein